MKTLNSLKKFSLALVAMTLMLTAANAQQRYKHMPRVKIGKNEKVVTVKQDRGVNTTTTAQMTTVEENVAVAETTTPVVENNTTVASTENVVVVETKTKSVVHHNKVVKEKKTADKNFFTTKLKENSKLMDVKDMKKTNMEKWVLIMIILYAVGIVFLILAFVFLYALFSAVAYYIFLIIGLLCLLAASIILPLGLAGVI